MASTGDIEINNNIVEEDLTDTQINETLEAKTADTKPSQAESSHMLTDEYNPDDEQEGNAFGYGWSYNEGLDSPEEVDKEEEILDEDAEYASGKTCWI